MLPVQLGEALFKKCPVYLGNAPMYNVRQSCDQKLKSKNRFPTGKIFLRLFFLYSFRIKSLNLVSLFIPEIANLHLENKLGQTYVIWYIKTQMIRYVSLVRFEGKHTNSNVKGLFIPALLEDKKKSLQSFLMFSLQR